MNALFSQSLNDKLKVKLARNFRGYIPYGDESGLKEVFEPKEGFSYGYPKSNASVDQLEQLSSTEQLLKELNKWPDQLSSKHIKHLEITFIEMVQVAKLLTWAISIKLNQDLVQLTKTGEDISIMRLFHYMANHSTSSTASSKPRVVLGSSPHTDWGFLTTIIQDSVNGLQFYHDNRWINVVNVPNGLIINGGDYLSYVTDGKYRSPIHRVVCSNQDRYSFVLFFYPSYGAPLQFPASIHHSGGTICHDSSDEGACPFLFNTLLDHGTVQRADYSNQSYSFGEYIIKKWFGVDRSETIEVNAVTSKEPSRFDDNKMQEINS